ncbi:MAG: epoxyqueuosine reductase QueH [Candidatus Cloacimonadaceae bacterium]
MSDKKKLLVHTCCAPCLIAPLQQLRQEWDVTALWYNPNIHPYMEYIRRRDALKDYAEKTNLPVIWQDEYDLEMYLSVTISRNTERCQSCYELRLERAAQIAMGKGFDAFTTTLLYSKYQRHKDIKAVGEKLAQSFGIDFYYQDWRDLWQQGIELSKEEKMYRQSYCGCIFSEKERYFKTSKALG